VLRVAHSALSSPLGTCMGNSLRPEAANAVVRSASAGRLIMNSLSTSA
jgi:hypothetical protein